MSENVRRTFGNDRARQAETYSKSLINCFYSLQRIVNTFRCKQVQKKRQKYTLLFLAAHQKFHMLANTCHRSLFSNWNSGYIRLGLLHCMTSYRIFTFVYNDFYLWELLQIYWQTLQANLNFILELIYSELDISMETFLTQVWLCTTGILFLY